MSVVLSYYFSKEEIFHDKILFYLLYPQQTVFVGGYNVFMLSVRTND